MAKKKLNTSYPYVAVEGVDNRLLDYALIQMYYLQIDKKVSKIVLDMKLINKTKNLTADNDSIELEKLVYAYHLYSNYNTYNNVVGKFYDAAMDTADETFELFTENGVPTYLTDKSEELTTEKEQLEFLLEMVTFFRLYKKGRFASEYIPTIVAHLKEQLPDVVELFEDDAPEEDWLDQLFTYIEEIYELEEELLPFVSEDIESLEALKEQMTKLIDQFGESLSTVDPEEYEKLCATVLEKEEELKSANKLLKNKDEQISKLQKASATKDKEVAALTKKFDDLKKQDGTKSAELSAQRKTVEDATQKYEQLLKRQDMNKDTMQKELEKAREQATQPLQLKLNDLKNFYEDKVETLESNVGRLQQTLNEERTELHALEAEVGRLRQFQEFYATLNSANLTLQAENESLQKELAHAKKQLEQQASVQPTVASQIQIAPAVEDDVEQIDDGIFGMLINNPEEVKRDTEHMATVTAAPMTNENQPQAGAIRVVTEENEINFDELLINRPD